MLGFLGDVSRRTNLSIKRLIVRGRSGRHKSASKVADRFSSTVGTPLNECCKMASSIEMAAQETRQVCPLQHYKTNTTNTVKSETIEKKHFSFGKRKIIPNTGLIKRMKTCLLGTFSITILKSALKDCHGFLFYFWNSRLSAAWFLAPETCLTL